MKDIFKDIEKKEFVLVFKVALVLIFLTGLPYLYGYLTAPKDTQFNGLHSLTAGDMPVYYSYIKQIKDGNFFNYDYFTSENQNLGMFNIVWFLAGTAARIFHLSAPAAYHLSRLAFILPLAAGLYFFISLIFQDKQLRKLSFLVATFASGVGFYFAGIFIQIFPSQKLDFYNPIDLWATESNIFLAAYQTPHFIASYLMMILIFSFFLLAYRRDKAKYAVIAGILALVFFNFHPFYIPLIFLVTGFYTLSDFLLQNKILWKKFYYLLVIFTLSLPSVVYHFYLLINDQVIKIRAGQNIILTGSVWSVILGFGLLAPFSVFGLFLSCKNKFNRNLLFCLIWAAINSFLIFFPGQFQNRYTEGLIIPLSVFSAIGINFFHVKFKNLFPSNIAGFALYVFLFIVFFAPTNFYNTVKDYYYFTVKEPKIFYLSDRKIDSWQWLENNAEPQKVILASANNSLFIPGFTRQKVYGAHDIETLYYENNKELLIKWFYGTNGNDGRKKEFLKKSKIDYVYYSPEEFLMGNFKPEEKDYLKEVYKNTQVNIYQFVGN